MSAPDANGWMPIDTAPRDGREILVRYEDGTEEGGVYFSDTRYCIIGAPQGSVGPGWMSTEVGLPVDEITHWQPLPKPPVTP